VVTEEAVTVPPVNPAFRLSVPLLPTIEPPVLVTVPAKVAVPLPQLIVPVLVTGEK
jgi:hypothetical protein